MVKLVRGKAQATPFQLAFARAGHAHAGVLLILALVCQLMVDDAELTGPWNWLAGSGVAVAALWAAAASVPTDSSPWCLRAPSCSPSAWGPSVWGC
jgi:hypothetical protein